MGIDRVIGVSTSPGATSKACTSVPSSAPASASVIRIRPVFATEYAEYSGRARRLIPLARFTIRPRLRRTIHGTTARQSRNPPRTWLETTSHHWSGSASHSGSSAASTDAGVVHQQVDPAQLLGDLLDGGLHGAPGR